MNDYLKIGYMLVKNNKITEKQLNEAILEQERLQAEANNRGLNYSNTKKIGDILVDKKLITSKELSEAVAKQFNLPLFDKLEIRSEDFDGSVVRLIKDSVAKELNAMALKKLSNGKYLVVIVDPGDMRTKITLKRLLRTEVSLMDLHVISRDNFQNLFNQIYNINLSIDNIRKEKKEEDKRRNQNELVLNGSNDITNIIDTVLSNAVKERASDIHIESLDNEIIVRYRIDTVPVIRHSFPKEIENMIIQKFYLECNLSIDKKQKPMDGRFEKTFNGKTYDFRVNFLPSFLPDRSSMKVSIRILNREKLSSKINEVGFTKRTLSNYERMIREPHGLILVVGPMGSGKTTTLYSTIEHLDPKRKIIVTLEDPPEFSIPYVNQCKISVENGFTYAEGLKSILRQDADIILVGEIRDSEVGKLAVQSAEIGRLVFSTLHVDNAVASVLRLNNLGVSPFFVASVLVGVVSQRLVRKICPHCIEDYTPTEDEVLQITSLLGVPRSSLNLKKGRGCDKCNNSGYLGLVPTIEVLNFKEIVALREAVADGELSVDKLTQIAVKHGYKPMIFDAFEKVALGLTTIQEVSRIVLDVNSRKIINDKINESNKSR